MPFFVYLLALSKNNEFANYYTGQTNDLKVRMQQHQKSIDTKNRRKYVGQFDAMKLLAFIEIESRDDALKLEKQLKKIPAPKKMQFMKEHGALII